MVVEEYTVNLDITLLQNQGDAEIEFEYMYVQMFILLCHFKIPSSLKSVDPLIAH